MRSIHFLRMLSATVVVVVLALAAWPRTAAPVADPEDGTTVEQAGLGAARYGDESAPQDSLSGTLLGGAAIEAARRIQRVRLHGAERAAPEEDGLERSVAAILRLRDARRAVLDHGSELARDASGAVAFHTNTPPPYTLV